MRSNSLHQFLPATLANIVMCAGVAGAANLVWTNVEGDWETVDNWLSDDVVPESRLPLAGERAQVYNGGLAKITAATGRIPGSGTLSMIRCYGGGGQIIQGGSTVDVSSIWIGNNGGGTYQLDQGTLTMTTTGNGQIDISSLNQGSQMGQFTQNGGTVDARSLRMNYKGSKGRAVYELSDGEFNISGNLKMVDDLSTEGSALFTQTGGSATIGGTIRLGRKAGDASGVGSAIVDLGGGEMTITSATPFLFTQPGAPVHVDFNGGVLNLIGEWDFASLTAIPESDFRVGGVPALAGNLKFESVTINSASFTRIFTDGEPPRVIKDVQVGDDGVTLVMQTQPGRTYGLYWSSDLENFFMRTELVAAHPSAAETVVGPFPHPAPGAERVFFRFGEPDMVDPALESASGDGRQVTVTFSESMNPGSLLTAGNYQLQEVGGALRSVTSVVPGALPGTVVLHILAPLANGAEYMLTVNGVTDTAGRPVPVDSQVLFTAFDPGGTVQVYILAGQSNMEGQAAVSLLEYQASNEPNIERFSHLKNPDGDWIVRDDIWVKFLDKHGSLTPGFGAGTFGAHFGPELEFGPAVARESAGPVLLIKAAWGGKSLYRDFRPPSSGDHPDGPQATDGEYYRAMIQEVQMTLGNLEDYFPDYQDQGYEIRGFAWFQGWNDMINADATAEYAANMANFIRDVRSDLEVPKLPFVIGQLGVGGLNPSSNAAIFKSAQAAAAALPEFDGNVALVPTDVYWDTVAQSVYDLPWNRDAETIALWQTVGSDRPYHYLGSALTYSEVGRALAQALLGLINTAP